MADTLDLEKEKLERGKALKVVTAALEEQRTLTTEANKKAFADNIAERVIFKEQKDAIVKQSIKEGIWESQKTKRDDLIKSEIAAGSLDQRVADEVYRQKKEKEDAELQKAFEKQVKLQSGEGGFRGMIKGMGSGFSEMIDAQKTMGDRLKDIGSAFSDDLSFLGDMMSPLASLPGMNLAMTIMKTSGQALLSLGTKEGRARAKEAINTAKMWVQQKAKWVWDKAQALKDFMLNKARFAWDKIQKAKERLSTRAGKLKEKGLRRGKSGMKKAGSWLAKAGKIILSLVVGLFAMIGAFAKEVLKPFKLLFSGIGARITKLFKPIKLPAKLTKGIKIVKDFFGKIGKFFGKIIAPFQKAVGVVSKLANPRIVGFMKTIGGVFGKLFWPITLLMGAWEAVKGFIAGFKSTEGGIGEKIMGGLLGAWQSLVDYLIMWPLDLIKDLIAWIGEKMGFDMSAVKDFSFSDMWKDISDKFIDGVMAVIRFVKAIAAGIGAGIMALWPGGEGPMEAFKRKFDEVMASPGGGKATTIEKPEGGTGEAMQKSQKDLDDARDLKNYQDANREYARNKSMQSSNNAVAISVTNEGSKIINDGTSPDEKTADNGF